MGKKMISELNGRPELPPVNASPDPLRGPAHDAGQIGTLSLVCTALASATYLRLSPALSLSGSSIRAKKTSRFSVTDDGRRNGLEFIANTSNSRFWTD